LYNSIYLIFFYNFYKIKIINQYETKPENIVAKIFLLKTPIHIAIIVAKILGLFSSCIEPKLSKKIAGNIIAGKIADGTYDKTSLILSLNISFLRRAIIENLVKKVITPQ
jgi:hypothetical protein